MGAGNFLQPDDGRSIKLLAQESRERKFSHAVIGKRCVQMIERLDTDFEFQDERGMLIQLVRRGYSQVNVITSKAGVIRGGHYHKLNTEAFFIVQGKCKVTVQKGGDIENAVFCAGDFFRIGPFVSHSFEYLEDTVLVSMYSLGVEMENGEKDTYSG